MTALRLGLGVAVALPALLLVSCAEERFQVPLSPPPSPPDLSFTLRPRLGGIAALFRWGAVPTATDYVLEIGSASGLRDVAVIPTGGALSEHLWEMPLKRTFYVRARARNPAGESTVSNEVRVESVDLRDAITALFLGLGPLAPTNGEYACVSRFRWMAFPQRATVRLRLSDATVGAPAQDAVRRAAGQFQAVTGNQVIVELTAEPDPRPGENEITVASHPDPPSVGQGCSYYGCTFMTVRDRAFIVSARAVLRSMNSVATYPHDAIGHGALGMCHIDGALIGGSQHSLMSGGPWGGSCDAPSNLCIALDLTPLDAAAAEAVYASGLPRGSVFEDFLSVGLVNPFPARESSAAGVADVPRGLRINDRDEVFVFGHPEP